MPAERRIVRILNPTGDCKYTTRKSAMKHVRKGDAVFEGLNAIRIVIDRDAGYTPKPFNYRPSFDLVGRGEAIRIGAAKRVEVFAAERRARLASAPGSHTEAEWKALLEKFGRRCLCCGATGVWLTKDHVTPLSEGGSDFISNIQPLCGPCNSRKGTKDVDYRVPLRLTA